jgi:hypothetical protein
MTVTSSVTPGESPSSQEEENPLREQLRKE